MAVCGDRYKYLAVTTDGYSFANPYGLFAEAYAFAQWRALAEKLTGIVNEHIVKLQAVEAVKDPKSPFFQKYAVEWTQLLRNLENLPSAAYAALSGVHAEEAIQEAMAVVSEALCILEQIDEAIEYYGDTPPKIPGVVPTPKERLRLPDLPSAGEMPWYVWAIGGAATIAIVAGLYQRARGPQGVRR